MGHIFGFEMMLAKRAADHLQAIPALSRRANVISALASPRRSRCHQKGGVGRQNADSACIVVPSAPVNAAMPATVAANMAPTPTGLMSYRCARLNSIPAGLRPSGLLITRSATSALTL